MGQEKPVHAFSTRRATLVVRRRTRSWASAVAAGAAAVTIVLGGAPAFADDGPGVAALDRELRALSEAAAAFGPDDRALAEIERRIDELLLLKAGLLADRLGLAETRQRIGAPAGGQADDLTSERAAAARVEETLAMGRWPAQLRLLREEAADSARRVGVRPSRSPEVLALTHAIRAASAEGRLWRLREAAGPGRRVLSKAEVRLLHWGRAALRLLNRSRAAL